MQAVHRRERFFLFSARKLAHQNMAVCPPWGGPVPLWRSRAAGDERRLGTNSNERYIYHPDIGKEEENFGGRDGSASKDCGDEFASMDRRDEPKISQSGRGEGGRGFEDRANQ